MALFDILKGGLGNLGNTGNLSGALGGLSGALGGLAGQAGTAASSLGRNMPGGMGGLLGAGALGALLGSMASNKALKNAALVGAGAVAWNFYQKWSQGRAEQQQTASTPVEQTPVRAGEHSFGGASQTPLALQQDHTAMLLLRAMVFAARADGHIDHTEQERISKVIAQMMPGQDSAQLVQNLMSEPLNPGVFTAQIDSVEQGEDLYRLSCLIVDIDHFMERSYIDGLAHALSIPAARKAQLEDEAQMAKQQLAAV